MFFNSALFWFLMGVLFILIAAGLNAFAKGRGWVMTWWKWVLSIIWYTIFTLTFYAAGILIGENEGSAAWKILLLGLFISLILGVGLWRLLMIKAKESAPPEPEPAPAEA